jgi:hypothetical protein
MSASPSNPFVLPGFGQTGEQAANPLLASMEMMRQAFTGMAGASAVPGATAMSPPMNPEDLEKRIAELKTVENWLKLNLSMLTSTIQGLEVQLATIQTLRSFVSSTSEEKEKQEVPAAAQAWWNMLQQQFGQVAAATAASMASAAKVTQPDDAEASPQPAAKRAAKKTTKK